MTTTLGHAVLGLLALEPGTGYDLARRLRRPVGYFWSAGHSQIYPELARLDAAGLVRHEVIDGAGPRASKRYRVTSAGRRELRRWLLATTPEVDEREILLRVYLLSVLRPAEAISVVASIREHHVRMLAHFRSQRREVTPSPGDWSPLATARATLEWGVTFEEGRIRWCDELLDTLRAAAGSDQTSLLSQPSPQH